MTTVEMLTKARTAMLRNEPFFGVLALRLEIVEDPSCDTMWTDGRTLGCNPDFLSRLTFEETVGVIAHEVLHSAMGHTYRRGTRDRHTWNEATDYTINGTLREAGFKLPAGGYYNGTFARMTPEDVYEIIKKDEGKKKPNPGDTSGSGSEGKGEGDAGEKGGGNDDRPGDPGRSGEVRDVPSKDGGEGGEADRREAEIDWKVAVSQAASMAAAMGDGMSEAIERAVKEILRPSIDWASALHRFVHEQTAKTETWNPPDRRFIWQGVYVPGLGGREAGHIVVGFDTSGSIGGAIVEKFAAEIAAVRDEVGAEVTVIYADNAVRRVEHFDKGEEIVLHPAGGGGTDFGPVFEYVDRENIQPACLIYLTDLAGTFPREEPPYPVLWAVMGGIEKVPFGEVLRIK